MLRRSYHHYYSIAQRLRKFLHGVFLDFSGKKIFALFLLLGYFLCAPSPIHQASSVVVPNIPRSIATKEALSVFEPFPFPQELQAQVNFWRNIFTKYSTKQAVIHDAWYLNVIYDVVDVQSTEFSSEREGWKAVKQKKKAYEERLVRLSEHWGQVRNMLPEERQLYDLFKDVPESQYFRRKFAGERVRVQVGQADRVKQGFMRVGQYLTEMKRIFASHELPEKLVYLPLIESAFNPFASSYAGAEGMWQFMRGTAKQYGLRMNSLIDERRDPLLATQAAAELLGDNYASTQSWPLAITAYNYGLQGIKNAAKSVESEDIATIIERYDGSRFGFASRNFYPEFLAAVDVCLRYTEYFGELESLPPIRLVQIPLTDYVSARTLSKYTGLSITELKALNPALNDSVFQRGNFIPKKYALNIIEADRQMFERGYAGIPHSAKYKYLQVKATHRVKKGQTLSVIAKRYKTSVKAIMRINGINNARKIKAGQTLKIPGGYVTLAQSSAPQRSQSTVSSSSVGKTTHKVTKGQTLSSIAEMYEISVDVITRLNGIKNPRRLKAGQTLILPNAAEHLVKEGQTLSTIARIHNTSIQALARVNNIKNPRKLKIGQVLKIPTIPEG